MSRPFRDPDAHTLVWMHGPPAPTRQEKGKKKEDARYVLYSVHSEAGDEDLERQHDRIPWDGDARRSGRSR